MSSALTVTRPTVDAPLVVLSAEVVAAIEALEARDRDLPPCTTPEQIQLTDRLAKEANDLAKAIEANRVEVKAAPLEWCRAIDEAAGAPRDRLLTLRKRRDAEILRVQQEQERKRREAEAERQRIEAEAEAKRRAAEQERQRLAEQELQRAEELARLEALAKDESDRETIEALRVEATVEAVAAREAVTRAEVAADRAASQAWVAAVESTPTPTPKARVHARKAFRARAVDTKLTPSHVGGICVVKEWHEPTIRTLLENGVEVPGWILVETTGATRR